MAVKAYLIRKSTKKIIKSGDYPKADMSPFLEGEIDPDYEWLVEHIPFDKPQYDGRIFIMTDVLPDLTDISNFEAHPEYPGIRQYKIQYNPVQREVADIKLAIDNAEAVVNDEMFTSASHIRTITFGLAAAVNKMNGQTLTADEDASLLDIQDKTVKFKKNKAENEVKKNQVDLNQTPDLDTGWER